MISTNPVLNPRLYCVSRCARVRRAALARIFWGVRSSTESELPQCTNERIPTRVAHNLRNQVPPGMGDQVPISRSEGEGCPSGAGADPSDVPRPGRSDRERARWQGPRARVGVGSAHGESFESDEADKRSIVTQRFLRSKLQQEFAHLRKRYWGRHFWARGYFCATSGRLTEEQIRNYIEGHDQEPPDSDFTVGQ